MIKDSGERKVFPSGGVRDMSEGKGRCDLLPLQEVVELLEYADERPALEKFSPIKGISYFIESAKEHPFGCGDFQYIYFALYKFMEEAGWDVYTTLIEVSKHFEEGAKKYKKNNWRLGLNASCYLDSGIRHYLKWKRGDRDEPHDRAFVWNMLCMLWTVRHRPECNDISSIEEVDDTRESTKDSSVKYMQPPALMKSDGEKSCLQCMDFISNYPINDSGWCRKYPCVNPNTDIYSICSQFEDKIE